MLGPGFQAGPGPGPKQSQLAPGPRLSGVFRRLMPAPRQSGSGGRPRLSLWQRPSWQPACTPTGPLLVSLPASYWRPAGWALCLGLCRGPSALPGLRQRPWAQTGMRWADSNVMTGVRGSAAQACVGEQTVEACGLPAFKPQSHAWLYSLGPVPSLYLCFPICKMG